MNIAEFSRENIARCLDPKGFNHPLDVWSESDWLCAVVGEIGEAANIVKKLNRVRDGIPGNKESPDELRAALADELADVYIYLDLVLQRGGFSPAEEIGADNFRAFVDRTVASVRQAHPKDEPTLSDLMTQVAYHAGQMILVGSTHWKFSNAAVRIVEHLAVMAHFIGACLPAAVRAKFDKTSAKIGWDYEAAGHD